MAEEQEVKVAAPEAEATPDPRPEENPVELLVRLQRKQLHHARIQTGLLSGMLAIVLVVGLALTAGVRTTVAQINSIDFDKINGAIDNASQIVDQVSRLDLQKVDGAVDALTEAAGNLSSVDMESINQAVEALGGAAGNLSRLDIEKLNNTVGTLQTVVDNLNAVAEKLRNPFGR